MSLFKGKWDKLKQSEPLKHFTIPLLSEISPLKQRVKVFLFSSDKEKKMIQNHRL